MPLSRLGVRARWRWVLLLLPLSLVAAACGEIGEPDLGVGQIAPGAAAEGEESPDEVEPAADESAESGATEVAPLPVFSPPRPDGYVPSLVVSSDEGVTVTDGSGQQEILEVGEPGAVYRRVVDDFFGGLVVEQDSASLPVIRWFRPDAEGSIVSDTGDRLLDVGFIDSTLEAHALVSPNPTTIDRIRLADAERAPFATLVAGQTLIDFSASEGLHAAIVADERCGELIFFNSGGALVDLGGPGSPPCVVARRPAYGAVDLSPDGTRVAYTVLTYRSDGVVASTELVVRELGSNAVVFTRPIGVDGESIHRLSFDGSRLAFLREGAEQSFVVEIPIEGEPVETIVPVAGEPIDVVFARQPLSVGR